MGAVTGGRAARFGAAALLLALTGTTVVPTVVAAADAVQFGQPTASGTFDKQLSFEQPITTVMRPAHVEILLRTPGADGPTVYSVDPPAAGAATLRYEVDLGGTHVMPNTTFTATWRITLDDGSSILGPPLDFTYADTRFDWKTLAGSVVRVHWVVGDQAFGKRALKIGDDAIAAASKLLGVTETEPIDFFVYADESAFYDALGPSTRENVGGEAHPDLRTVYALITPSDIDAGWVSIVVPHELTHVVFQSAVENPYHDPPHWLNEGLAVYLAQGYVDSDRRQVEAAAQAGTIIPLDGLDGAFPTTRDRFYLAYAESVAAVDRIVRVNGRDALASLIRSYHAGVSDDEAFGAALGRDVAGFETDWLAEIGASAPARTGPRPAPAGPLPAGWTGPQPNPSFEVTGSIPPAPSAPRPTRTGDDPITQLLVPSFSVLGIVLIVVLVILAGRRGTRRRLAEDAVRWNQLYGRPVDREGPTDPGRDVNAAPADDAPRHP